MEEKNIYTFLKSLEFEYEGILEDFFKEYCLDKAIEFRRDRTSEEREPNYINFILHAFDWSDSPQKYLYWYNIERLYREYIKK